MASFLCPLALIVPGTQHMLDNAIRELLLALPIWTAWQAQSKVVCQWLGSQGHREFLQARLPPGHPRTPKLRKSFERAPDRFAKWRWQTLGNVTRDLVRMQAAVQAAVSTMAGPADLNTREHDVARKFLEATRDPEFWGRAQGLGQLSKPIRDISGWAKGCDCHKA